MSRTLLSLGIAAALFTGVFAFGTTDVSAAVWTPNQPLVPCGGTAETRNAGKCDFNALIQLVQNIITFLFWLAVPVSIALFAYAGYLYLISGVVDQRAKAKQIFWDVIWGIIFMAIAWTVVYLITNTLLQAPYKGDAILQPR